MMISGAGREFIIKDTHRGLYYEDGKLTKCDRSRSLQDPATTPMATTTTDGRVHAGRRS